VDSKATRINCKIQRQMEHQFGHQVVDLTLTSVTMTRLRLDCKLCCSAMLKSFANVKSLKLAPRRGEIPLNELSVIASHLQHLEHLELIFDDRVELGNHFESWPSMPNLKVLIVNRVGLLTKEGVFNLRYMCPLLDTIKLYSMRGSKITDLLKFTFQCFHNIKSITYRGGRCPDISELNYIKDKVGWRLKELDVSAYIQPHVIIKLFKNNDFLEIVRCKSGALEVTRRIYYEVEVLNAYTLESIEQPLKNRRRLHLEENTSSDSETSDSEESSNSSSSSSSDNDED